MSADLEKRLRNAQMVSVEEGNVTSEPIPICQEAADALSRKDEEIARLNAALDEARLKRKIANDEANRWAKRASDLAAEAWAAGREAAAKVARRFDDGAPEQQLLADCEDYRAGRNSAARSIEAAIRALSPPERAAEGAP